MFKKLKWRQLLIGIALIASGAIFTQPVLTAVGASVLSDPDVVGSESYTHEGAEQ